MNEELERMIDAQGLAAVLESIAQICAAKSQHCVEAWGDAGLARDWLRASGRITQCAASTAVRELSP